MAVRLDGTRRGWLLAGAGAAALLARRARAQVPVAQAGDWVTCINEHPIAQLNRPLTPGEAIPLSALSGWRLPPPATLSPAPPCPRCGAVWFHLSDFGSRPQVHVAGKGWLPD